MRTETEFLNSIDARFPYADFTRGLELVDEACSISANAAFGLVEELARLPLGVEAPVEPRLRLLAECERRMDHPLVGIIFPIAESIIRGNDVPVLACKDAMGMVAQYPDQYGALNIAYFACDDIDGVLDNEYQRVVGAWRTA